MAYHLPVLSFSDVLSSGHFPLLTTYTGTPLHDDASDEQFWQVSTLIWHSLR